MSFQPQWELESSGRRPLQQPASNIRACCADTSSQEHHLLFRSVPQKGVKSSVNGVPMQFQAAAKVPRKASHDIGRLLMRPCITKMPPCSPTTAYLDKLYPPPFAPPVPSNIMTRSSDANEKSTLVVTAHCRWVINKVRLHTPSLGLSMVKASR